MSQTSPAVSVAMVTFNHESYIAEAVQSVLRQSMPDFELVIVNDGSTDSTEEIVKTFRDPRVRYIYQDNQGPSAAINAAFRASRGKFIAQMSGDDVCLPNRLERQLDFISRNDASVAFSWVEFIDEHSRPVRDHHHLSEVFFHRHRTRADVVRALFYGGNCYCAVTALFRKEVFDKEQLFSLTSIQLQDYEMWLRLSKRYELPLQEERLVRYRLLPRGESLSDPVNNIRMWFEMHQILREVFDDISEELFRQSFRDVLRNPDFQGQLSFELEKAFLFLTHSSYLIQNIGIEKLSKLLQDEQMLAISKQEYDFGLVDLFKLTREVALATDNVLLRDTQRELERSTEQINWMEKSKFWKLRNQWFALKGNEPRPPWEI